MIATLRTQDIDAAGVPVMAGSRVQQFPMPTSQDTSLSVGNIRKIPHLAIRTRSDETLNSDVSRSSEESLYDSQHLRVRTALIAPSPVGSVRSPVSTAHLGPDGDSTQGRGQSQRHATSKKKSSGVFGFLTLREPSTTALEAFAENEKRKAAQRGARSAAVGMPGVSSQRLPDHVPKVNSKWDGLPEVPKKKTFEHRESDARSFSLTRSDSGLANNPYVFSKPLLRRERDVKNLTVAVNEVSSFDMVQPAPAPRRVA